jgi:transcriptional regulator with XRE-family HTH domain
MSIGEKIKDLRKEKGINQQEIADLIGMHRSNYSKIENGQRELSVSALSNIASFFDLSTDQLMGEPDFPSEVKVADKTIMEKVKMIDQLEDEEKQTIFKMIDAFITNKKFKNFFKENIPA